MLMPSNKRRKGALGKKGKKAKTGAAAAPATPDASDDEDGGSSSSSFGISSTFGSSGGGGYKFTSEVKTPSKELTQEHAEFQDKLSEEGFGWFSKDWNLKKLEKKIKELEADKIAEETKEYEAEAKRAKPPKPEEIAGKDQDEIEDDDALFKKYVTWRKDVKDWKAEEPKSGEDVRAAAIKKIDKAVKVPRKKLKTKLAELREKRKGIVNHINNIKYHPMFGDEQDFASRFKKAEDKMRDSVRKYNDTANKYADDEYNFNIPRAHLVLSTQSIVSVYSTELEQIYKMADAKLKKYIDGCRIRSFVEGRELKRNLALPLADGKDGKFAVAMKTVKVDGEDTEVPVIQNGSAQVQVSSKNNFKNPFFSNDQWLLNEIATFEEQSKSDAKNEGHSDAEDAYDHHGEPMLHCTRV